MYARRQGSAWSANAPAKLNLYLEILGRRSDGFHELETLMVPVRLYDQLRWSPLPESADFHFFCHDVRAQRERHSPAPPGDQTNLAVRAAKLLAEEGGVRPRGRLDLWKRIPSAAGLGGGSSDAAATLSLLNSAWELGLSSSALHRLACQLGSDVPFFLGNGAAVCRGTGSRVEALPQLRPLHFVLVKPPLGASTVEVYGNLDAKPADQQAQQRSCQRIKDLTTALANGSWRHLNQLVVNRLQQTAEKLNPWIGMAKKAFESCACLAHAMTGSGSAYFGITPTARHALHVSRKIFAMRLGAVYVTAACR